MRITWSLPVRGERLGTVPGEGPASTRGDLVRARALIDALRALGHDVDVVEDAARPGAGLAVTGYRSVVRRLLPRRLALVARDLGRVLHARAHARHVLASLTRTRADLLVETQVHFAGSGEIAATASGVPLILDDCSPSHEEIALGCGLPGLARAILRRQAACAKALIVPSAALGDALAAEGLPAERVRMVPNGVDLGAFAGAAGQRAGERERLGLGGRIALVFAGSFQAWHQSQLLSISLSRLDCRQVALVLAGDGPGRAACASACRQVRDLLVVELGPVPHAGIPAVLAACDVGVLPGTNAWGQPMKLVEYAAARLALVAPDVPPVREMIEPGRNGLLFAPGDADGLAAALSEVLANDALRARLGSAAREDIAETASWSSRASELLRAAGG